MPLAMHPAVFTGPVFRCGHTWDGCYAACHNGQGVILDTVASGGLLLDVMTRGGCKQLGKGRERLRGREELGVTTVLKESQSWT